jgi:hypothetical protein
MTTNRAARIEGLIQVLILLFMGVMAGAASFMHIHDVTVTHGQPSWIGWANAVVVELMSIVAGLDIRRRKRSAQPPGFVLGVLLTAIGISLAAQVAEAEPSIWGWTVAALPALGLLAVVKIVLSRTTASSPDHPTNAGRTPGVIPDRTDNSSGDPLPGRLDTTTALPVSQTAAHAPQTGEPVPAAQPSLGRPADQLHRMSPVPDHGPTSGPKGTPSGPDRVPSGRTGPVRHRTDTRPGPDQGPPTGPTLDQTDATAVHRLDDVLHLGHAVADELRRQRLPLTRATLIAGIRATGHTIGTDKATALLRQLKTTHPARCP